MDECKIESCNYDMISGRDLIHSLGINLLFDTAQVSWDNVTVFMQLPSRLQGDWVDELEQELLYAHDPDTTDAERIQQIIDAKYCPADLNKIVAVCAHLSKIEQKQSLKLLQNYEHRFNGTLGTWQTDPVDLELKDPDVKPHHSKPYPVTHSQEKKLKEELERLCQYGILRKIN